MDQTVTKLDCLYQLLPNYSIREIVPPALLLEAVENNILQLLIDLNKQAPFRELHWLITGSDDRISFETLKGEFLGSLIGLAKDVVGLLDCPTSLPAGTLESLDSNKSGLLSDLNRQSGDTLDDEVWEQLKEFLDKYDENMEDDGEEEEDDEEEGYE